MTTNEQRKHAGFLTPLQLAMTAINAALYPAVGVATYFGVFAPPPLGFVRFWPAVVVPGVFATLFGPWVGGIGAAIGIFASDMVITGNAFLSLTVGVPANFIGFFLVGYIARKQLNLKKLVPVFLIGALTLIVGVYSIATIPETRSLFQIQLSVIETIILFLATVGGSYLLIIIVAALWREWRSYGVGSVIGLGVGSIIIGLGLAIYTKSPIYLSLGWFIWTFTTEIPFLLLLGPPVLKACYKAFPSSKPPEERST
jgi:hypothetical protein